ncbi:MAG: hypothetical protein WCS43_05835 [Verrucomicrobiota bacterium]
MPPFHGLSPAGYSITMPAVTPKKNPKPRPPGHVLVPAAAIGGLSLVLATGLEALGFLNRLNTEIAEQFSRDGQEKFPNHLPDWSIWLAAAAFSFALAAAILATPGHARRAVLWITAVVLTGAWAPVLSLAAHSPDIAAPWIATLWSGVCAMVYAANHHMAADEKTPDRR